MVYLYHQKILDNNIYYLYKLQQTNYYNSDQLYNDEANLVYIDYQRYPFFQYKMCGSGVGLYNRVQNKHLLIFSALLLN